MKGQLGFDFLPKTYDYWVVAGWGRIRTSDDGQYLIDLILTKLQILGGLQKEQYPDFKLDNYQISVPCSLSVLRAFSPGTIIKDQHIVATVTDYRSSAKRITIERTQSLARALFGELFGQSPVRFEQGRKNPYYFVCQSDMAKMPVHYFQFRLGVVIVPDFVIANYYFFGSAGMIHSLIDGTIGAEGKRNTLYDPTKNGIIETEKNKKIVAIRLEKGMKDIDAYKIARIAFDDFLRTKCLEISANRIESKDSFISCGYPIEGQVSLTVYGRNISSSKGIYYYVYHIAHCDSKPPFDGLAFTRDNHGADRRSRMKQSMSANEAIQLQHTTVADYMPNKPINAGTGKADFRSKDRSIPSNIPELNNINEQLVVKLAPDENDPVIGQRLEHFTLTLGALSHTISTIRQGTSRAVGISLDTLVALIYKRKFDCFDLVKSSTKMLFDKLRSSEQSLAASTIVRVPLPFPGCNYSRFDIEPFRYKPKERKFCYMLVKKVGFRLYRCVYIEELLINGKYFYVMDIEPKYSKTASSGEYKYDRHLAVIIATTTQMSDFKIIQVITSLAENFGKWDFIRYFQCRFQTLRHTSTEAMSDTMKSFISADYP